MDGAEGGDSSRREESSPSDEVSDEVLVESDEAAVDQSSRSPPRSSPEPKLVIAEEGASGVGPLPARPGQGFTCEEELEELMDRLRVNPLLRTRVEEHLIEEGRALNSARAQGIFLLFQENIALVDD
jgi:hypothetical protein